MADPVLRDAIVVRDHLGARMAIWFVEAGSPIGEVEPFVRYNVEWRGWTLHRRRLDPATPVGPLDNPIGEVPEALPPIPGEGEKGREG